MSAGHSHTRLLPSSYFFNIGQEYFPDFVITHLNSSVSLAPYINLSKSRGNYYELTNEVSLLCILSTMPHANIRQVLSILVIDMAKRGGGGDVLQKYSSSNPSQFIFIVTGIL